MPILCIERAQHPNKRQEREKNEQKQITKGRKKERERKKTEKRKKPGLSTNHLRIMENIHHFFLLPFLLSLSISLCRLFCFLSVHLFILFHIDWVDWNHVLLWLAFNSESYPNTWMSESFIWLNTRRTDSFVVSVFGFYFDIDVLRPSAMLP